MIDRDKKKIEQELFDYSGDKQRTVDKCMQVLEAQAAKPKRSAASKRRIALGIGCILVVVIVALSVTLPILLTQENPSDPDSGSGDEIFYFDQSELVMEWIDDPELFFAQNEWDIESVDGNYVTTWNAYCDKNGVLVMVSQEIMTLTETGVDTGSVKVYKSNSVNLGMENADIFEIREIDGVQIKYCVMDMGASITTEFMFEHDGFKYYFVIQSTQDDVIERYFKIITQ